MSLLSYQLRLKRYQRELGLDDRTFNALDVKYSDINLLKQLQILNPVIAVPAPAPAPAPTNTGWYGVLQIGNIGETGNSIYITVESVDGAIVTELIPQTLVTSEDLETDYLYLNLAIGNRLTSPSTIIRVYWSLVTGSIDDFTFDGLQLIQSYFDYFDTQVLSGFIDEGNLQIIFTTFL
jgi:hypothetical protein